MTTPEPRPFAAQAVRVAGSTGHAAAIADADHAVTNHLQQLRVELEALLVELLDLHTHLADLADTRQSVGIGFMTPAAQAAAAAAAIADRSAVQGLTIRHDEPGHAWLNGLPGIASGPVPAPVTITAVSASAEIHAALAHHVRRIVEHWAPVRAVEIPVVDLGTPLDLTVLRAARPVVDRAQWTWSWATSDSSRDSIPADDVPTLPHLASVLADLAARVTGTAGVQLLTAVVRDLTRVRSTARDVVDGPAATPFPQPCPWCGHRSLVTHLRAEGRDTWFVRCEGTHRCVCDDQWCDCHTATGKPYRHEWVNSGRAKNPVDGRSRHALTSLIDQRAQEQTIETTARDRLALIRDLHTPTWVDDDGVVHEHLIVVDDETVPGCITCSHGSDPTAAPWPCPTYRLTDLDDPMTGDTAGPTS